MSGKKLGVFSTVIAFFLGVGVTVGVQSFSSSVTLSPALSHVQPFVAVAPVSNVSAGSGAGSTGTQNAPVAPVSGGILTTEQITNQVGPAVVTVINRQKFSGSRRVAQVPGRFRTIAGGEHREQQAFR